VPSPRDPTCPNPTQTHHNAVSPSSSAPLASGGDSGSGLETDSLRPMRGVSSNSGLHSGHSPSPGTRPPSSAPRPTPLPPPLPPYPSALPSPGICSAAGAALAGVGLGPASRGAGVPAGQGGVAAMAEPKAAGLVSAAAPAPPMGVQNCSGGGVPGQPGTGKKWYSTTCLTNVTSIINLPEHVDGEAASGTVHQRRKVTWPSGLVLPPGLTSGLGVGM